MTDDQTPLDPPEDEPINPDPADDEPDPNAEQPPEIGDVGEEPHD